LEKGFEIVSTLPIWQFDVLLLILVVLFAVVALSIRNLMGAAVVFGAYSFMMCQRIGRPPTSTIGFGRYSVSSLNRVPRPPANNTAFTTVPSVDRTEGKV